MTVAPRNASRLETFLYRAAGDLDAEMKNARTDAEALHAQIGRQLCVKAFHDIAAARRKA